MNRHSYPLSRAHPWHGVSIGPDAPAIVTVYIEIVPTDTVKYELDKTTGILKVDRPQLYSNVCPSLYGFVPQTWCGENVARFCGERTGRGGIVGDGDPLDICVLTEKTISHGDILVQAFPIGGIRLLDGNEADDKIIAVLKGDAAYAHWKDVSDCPPLLIDRLRHYFLTYKQRPDEMRAGERPTFPVNPSARPATTGGPDAGAAGSPAPATTPTPAPPAAVSASASSGDRPQVEIIDIYGVSDALEVIRMSRKDYRDEFGPSR